MLSHEFEAGIDRMLKYWKNTSTKWDDNIKNEYQRAFERWTYSRWILAVDTAIQNSDFFPRISELRRFGKADEMPKDDVVDDVDSCEHCAKGHITFGFQKNGVSYERYLACSCLAGDRVVKKMLVMAKRMHHSADPQMLRYANAFENIGGLSTAKAGIGTGVVS